MCNSCEVVIVEMTAGLGFGKCDHPLDEILPVLRAMRFGQTPCPEGIGFGERRLHHADHLVGFRLNPLHVVRVDGKTGIRDVFLGTAALQTVERYARRWRVAEGKLWRGKKGPLTESGVHQAIARLCGRAGVPDKGVHAFRRAAASQMKRLGMQDSDILEVMGWKDVTMLRRYIAAVAGELAQEAHDRFSPGNAVGLR